jgi:hypothetical protein
MAPDHKTCLLRCEKCGRSVPTEMAKLMTYNTAGWPKCCNDVMILYTRAEPPEPPKPAPAGPPG